MMTKNLKILSCIVLGLLIFLVLMVYAKSWQDPYAEEVPQAHNWAQTEYYRYRNILYPHNEAELVEIIKHANRSHKKISVIGSQHSWPRVYNQGTWISLNKLNIIKGVSVKNQTVTVEAGAKIQDLAQYLHTLGFSLVGLGSIQAQTVGGAIANDINGADFFHISDGLLGFRMVSASGKVIKVDDNASKGQVKLLRTMKYSLGLAGVMTEATLSLRPSTYNRVFWHQVDREHIKKVINNLNQPSELTYLYMSPPPNLFLETFVPIDEKSISQKDRVVADNKINDPYDLNVKKVFIDWYGVKLIHKLESLLPASIRGKLVAWGQSFHRSQLAEMSQANSRVKQVRRSWTNLTPVYMMTEFYISQSKFDDFFNAIDQFLSLEAKTHDQYSFYGVKFRFFKIQDGDTTSPYLMPFSHDYFGVMLFHSPYYPYQDFLSRFSKLCMKYGGVPSFGHLSYVKHDYIKKRLGTQLFEFKSMIEQLDPNHVFSKRIYDKMLWGRESQMT